MTSQCRKQPAEPGFSTLADTADVDKLIAQKAAIGFVAGRRWPFGSARVVIEFLPDPNWNPPPGAQMPLSTSMPVAG